jgi:hypothetical protein
MDPPLLLRRQRLAHDQRHVQVRIEQRARVEVDAALAEARAVGADHDHGGVGEAAGRMQSLQQAADLGVEVGQLAVVAQVVVA